MLLKKLLLTSAIVSFTMAGNGLAQAQTVQDHYKNVIIKKPYSVQVCTQGNGKSDLSNLSSLQMLCPHQCTCLQSDETLANV